MDRIITAFCIVLAWITRNLQTFPGRWRVLSFLRTKRSLLQRVPPFIMEIAPGVSVEYPPDVTFDVYLEGCSRLPVWRTELLSFISVGDCVLDIGANIGHFTVELANRVGPRGQVHAFEASPFVIPFLAKNIQRNDIEHVTIHNFAASDAEGSISFNAPDGASPLGSIRKITERETIQLTVPCAPIDAMLQQLKCVTYAKIDVEGAELKVLNGMSKLIARDRPIVAIEVTDGWLRTLGGTAKAVCVFFLEQKYILYRIDRDHPEILFDVPAEQFELFAVPHERASTFEVLPPSIPWITSRRLPSDGNFLATEHYPDCGRSLLWHVVGTHCFSSWVTAKND